MFSDVDECASNPCQNGATCNDQVNGYTCTCSGGWTGTICDQGKLLCFVLNFLISLVGVKCRTIQRNFRITTLLKPGRFFNTPGPIYTSPDYARLLLYDVYRYSSREYGEFQ